MQWCMLGSRTAVTSTPARVRALFHEPTSLATLSSCQPRLYSGTKARTKGGPQTSDDTVQQDGQPRLVNDGDRVLRSRHLLRAILRECTYLPDSFARQWMTQYTLHRFRTYTFKGWKNRNNEDYGSRLRAKEKEARGWVAYLRRANMGERRCLMRILFMAYGRIGKRRHELMSPLLPKEAREQMSHSDSGDEEFDDARAVESTPQHGAEDIEIPAISPRMTGRADADATLTRKVEPQLTPQLRALLISQIQTSPPDLTRRNPRRITQEIPLFNVWLRPMPQKRIRNMHKRHYAGLLDRVLPPLPTQDWKRLLDLSNGTAPIEAFVPRRQATAHVENISQAQVGTNALETVVAFGKPPSRALGRNKGHALTPRYMRRLYARVLSQCPLMEWDNEKKEWTVTWGEQALRQAPHTSTSEKGRLDVDGALRDETTNVGGGKLEGVGA